MAAPPDHKPVSCATHATWNTCAVHASCSAAGVTAVQSFNVGSIADCSGSGLLQLQGVETTLLGRLAAGASPMSCLVANGLRSSSRETSLSSLPSHCSLRQLPPPPPPPIEPSHRQRHTAARRHARRIARAAAVVAAAATADAGGAHLSMAEDVAPAPAACKVRRGQPAGSLLWQPHLQAAGNQPSLHHGASPVLMGSNSTTTACPPHSLQTPRAVMALACLAMALAAVHRVAFSVLALPIQAALGLSMPDMGRAHAALLLGYLLGQVRGGGVGRRTVGREARREEGRRQGGPFAAVSHGTSTGAWRAFSPVCLSCIARFPTLMPGPQRACCIAPHHPFLRSLRAFWPTE